MSSTIMVIDDRIENLKILEHILSDSYEVILHDNGYSALTDLSINDSLPDLILLDIIMPGIDGYEVLEELKLSDDHKDIPVICVTASDTEAKALSLGANDFISKPFEPEIIHMRVSNQILLQRHVHELELMVKDKIDEALAMRDNVVMVLADIIEYRSIESGSHVRRVVKYGEIIIDYLLENNEVYAEKINDITKEAFLKAIPMHDIGKIGVPDKILLKPGRLTDAEFEIMKTHTTIGKDIIDSIFKTSRDNASFLECSADIALHHHERYDGTGYPYGLKGKEIPLSARIMAIADVYDALVTKRVYKDAMYHEDAVKIIVDEAGTHFDPVVVDAFVNTKRQFQMYTDPTNAMRQESLAYAY